MEKSQKRKTANGSLQPLRRSERGGNRRGYNGHGSGYKRSFRMGRHRSRKSTMPYPVVLVGMMGCGKTTISRGIAEYFGVKAKDSDVEIERAANCTITEIFEKYGEDYFRDGERKVINRLLDNPKAGIIATGGGAYMNDETRALINEKSICVWLRADLETIWDRVAKRDTRPLLRRPDAKIFLSQLLDERTPFYEQAHVIVDVDNKSKVDTVRKIIHSIKTYIKQQKQVENPKFMVKKWHKRPPKNTNSQTQETQF